MNQTKHGDAKVGKVTRLHSIWRGIFKRCNPANAISATRRYAARGISVCPEWQDYPTFKAWAESAGYAETLSIDRIENNGNYTPENCRWVTKQAQARNRRTSRHLTVDGRTLTVAEWAEVKGVNPRLISVRLGRGWDAARAVNTPL